MTVAAVVIRVPISDREPPSVRVQRQRERARTALRRCAELCGAPAYGWVQDAGGAPVPNQAWHWSLSHKRRLAAAAIARCPIGIDVEEIVPRREDLFNEIGTEEEWRLMGERTWPAFYRLWTAKEATLKANGHGIGRLASCRIAAVTGEELLTVDFEGRSWAVQHAGFEGHLLALAGSPAKVAWQEA